MFWWFLWASYFLGVSDGLIWGLLFKVSFSPPPTFASARFVCRLLSLIKVPCHLVTSLFQSCFYSMANCKLTW
jgi:hypothetical protein